MGGGCEEGVGGGCGRRMWEEDVGGGCEEGVGGTQGCYVRLVSCLDSETPFV